MSTVHPSIIPPTHEVLANAAELISGHFTKGVFARRSENGELCYCTQGALRAAVGFEFFDARDGIVGFHPPAKPGVSPTAFYGAVEAAGAVVADHLGVPLSTLTVLRCETCGGECRDES